MCYCERQHFSSPMYDAQSCASRSPPRQQHKAPHAQHHKRQNVCLQLVLCAAVIAVVAALRHVLSLNSALCPVLRLLGSSPVVGGVVLTAGPVKPYVAQAEATYGSLACNHEGAPVVGVRVCTCMCSCVCASARVCVGHGVVRERLRGVCASVFVLRVCVSERMRSMRVHVHALKGASKCVCCACH